MAHQKDCSAGEKTEESRSRISDEITCPRSSREQKESSSGRISPSSWDDSGDDLTESNSSVGFGYLFRKQINSDKDENSCDSVRKDLIDFAAENHGERPHASEIVAKAEADDRRFTLARVKRRTRSSDSSPINEIDRMVNKLEDNLENDDDGFDAETKAHGEWKNYSSEMRRDIDEKGNAGSDGTLLKNDWDDVLDEEETLFAFGDDLNDQNLLLIHSMVMQSRSSTFNIFGDSTLMSQSRNDEFFDGTEISDLRHRISTAKLASIVEVEETRSGTSVKSCETSPRSEIADAGTDDTVDATYDFATGSANENANDRSIETSRHANAGTSRNASEIRIGNSPENDRNRIRSSAEMFLKAIETTGKFERAKDMWKNISDYPDEDESDVLRYGIQMKNSKYVDCSLKYSFRNGADGPASVSTNRDPRLNVATSEMSDPGRSLEEAWNSDFAYANGLKMEEEKNSLCGKVRGEIVRTESSTKRDAENSGKGSVKISETKDIADSSPDMEEGESSGRVDCDGLCGEQWFDAMADRDDARERVNTLKSMYRMQEDKTTEERSMREERNVRRNDGHNLRLPADDANALDESRVLYDSMPRSGRESFLIKREKGNNSGRTACKLEKKELGSNFFNRLDYFFGGNDGNGLETFYYRREMRKGKRSIEEDGDSSETESDRYDDGNAANRRNARENVRHSVFEMENNPVSPDLEIGKFDAASGPRDKSRSEPSAVERNGTDSRSKNRILIDLELSDAEEKCSTMERKIFVDTPGDGKGSKKSDDDSERESDALSPGVKRISFSESSKSKEEGCPSTKSSARDGKPTKTGRSATTKSYRLDGEDYFGSREDSGRNECNAFDCEQLGDGDFGCGKWNAGDYERASSHFPLDRGDIKYENYQKSNAKTEWEKLITRLDDREQTKDTEPFRNFFWLDVEESPRRTDANEKFWRKHPHEKRRDRHADGFTFRKPSRQCNGQRQTPRRKINQRSKWSLTENCKSEWTDSISQLSNASTQIPSAKSRKFRAAKATKRKRKSAIFRAAKMHKYNACTDEDASPIFDETRDVRSASDYFAGQISVGSFFKKLRVLSAKENSPERKKNWLVNASTRGKKSIWELLSLRKRNAKDDCQERRGINYRHDRRSSVPNPTDLCSNNSEESPGCFRDFFKQLVNFFTVSSPARNKTKLFT